MILFNRSNVKKIADADIVIIGVPDESKSHANRKGSSKGPDAIRLASNQTEFFERKGKSISILPMRGKTDNKRVLDMGNIQRNHLYSVIFDLISNNKIPIVIGGDHSITSISLHALGDALDKVGLIYLDAHPDFVSSTRDYYGSVLADSAKYLDFDKSILIGTRSAEPEELENAYKVGLEIVTPLDIVEYGISHITKKVVAKTGNKKYISIDLDCLDPAFAPGVSVPSPAGIQSADLIYIIKQAISKGIVGMDIVECNPDFDVNNMTASLGARIVFESIASIDTA
jgi:agmatinase